MRPKRPVVLLTMIVGVALAAPCHGADQSAPWQAAVVAGSGTAAAEHANRLQVYGDVEGDERWDGLAAYTVGRLELICVEGLRLDDLSVAAGEHFPGRPLSTWRPLRAVLSDATTGIELMSLETSPGCVARPSSTVRLEAEVVDVGTGVGPDVYLGIDVAGKIALASGELPEVYREAVLERNALGIISYFEDELERGILDPEQLPSRSFVDDRSNRVRPDTFAMTVMQGTALDMRRTILRGQQVRLTVDINTDLREAEIQAVSARLLPPAVATEARDAQPLLLISDFGVGGDIVKVGGAAALLEVANTLATATESGSLELVRPVVFLWSSDPASVRSFVAVNDLAPVAAFGLGDVGTGHGLSSVLHLVTPPDSHATWLSDWAAVTIDRTLLPGADLDRDEPPRWLLEEDAYDPDCDPFLLNRENIAFPTLLLSEGPACGTNRAATESGNSEFDEAYLQSVIAASLEVIRPMVTGEQPSDAALNRMGKHLLTRYWIRALGAFEAVDDVLAQAKGPGETEQRGIEALDAARSGAETQLDAWRGSLPDTKIDELHDWIEAVDDLMRSRMLAMATATSTVAAPPRVDTAAGGTGTSPSPPPRATPVPSRTVQRQATPSVETVTQHPPPVATRASTPRPPTPRPVPPTVVPPTPTPPIVSPAIEEAETNLANGKRLYEDGNCEDARAELERIGDQTPGQFEKATVLITVIDKRMEMSRTAYREGLTHLAERRNDQALTFFQRVVPCTENEYRQAQDRIRSIQASASRSAGDSECESLGVLRATRAQGDGRTIRGRLKIGEKIVYCFGAEMPGYGDLEVLVPMGFRAEGAGLVIAQGFKTFSDSDKRYMRYYAEKVTPKTRVEVTLLNKQSSTEEFECELYLYPR
jgi:hypothetical protein